MAEREQLKREQLRREQSGRRTGLVLEGGGMRGIYTAGILDVFMEAGVHFDGVIGVSAGAIHGCSFVSGQKGRSIRYYKKYCNDRRFMSFFNVITTGDIAREDFCYHKIPEELDPYDFEAFERSGTEFYVGCSNVDTGKPEYIRLTDMRGQIDFMRASASLPYVSRTVKAGGMKLLDGGCTDSIPLRPFLKMGFKRNVVILTREKGYRKKPEHAKMARLFYPRHPAFVRALSRRHITYNRTVEWIDRLEAEGRIFVIRPREPLNIGRMEHNPEELQRVYDIGRADGKEQLEAMERWLTR